MGIATRTNGTAPPDIALADIDLGAWDFWALDDDQRDGAFATLRREAPISFWAEPVQEGFAKGGGHWALTGLDDVFYASRHPEIFSSSPNITINDQTPEVSEYFGSMIVLDDPRHQRLRSIVSRAFTPKVVARIETSVRDRARRLVADELRRSVPPKGGGGYRDFGSRSRPPTGRGHGRQTSRRNSRGGQRVGRPAAVAGHLRHDGRPRGRPSKDISLDQRHPRIRRSRSDNGIRRFRSGLNGDRGLRQRVGRGSPRQSPRRSDDEPGGGRGRRRAVDLGRGRVVFHP